ncbi:hypothetical protein GCM10027020_28760 [Nocardioides salsibiostraticola]
MSTLDIDVLRNLSLALPLLGTVVAVLVLQWLDRTRPAARPRTSPRVVGAAFLATAYAWCGVLAVHALPVTATWWRVPDGPTTLLGLSLETSLGWALMWGSLPALLGGRVRWWVGAFVWLDVVLMPRLGPLVVLEPDWWQGEFLLLMVVLLPTTVLALATRERRLLGVRVALQAGLFAALVLWLLPSIAMARTGDTWASLLEHSTPVRAGLLAVAVGCAVPALAAVAELARVGHGTPFPWDPPERLVTTGPYAYVANPMQLGACGLLLVLAAGVGSWWIVLAALTAGLFSTVLAERHERSTMGARWPDHAAYRRAVRSWRPLWRPYIATGADLWIDETCAVCRATGFALTALQPTGLIVLPAARAPRGLTRARWRLPLEPEPVIDRGIAALARALEQTTLPWAWCGWAVRLPGVVHVLGVVVDACGLGPRAAGGAATSYGPHVADQRAASSR